MPPLLDVTAADDLAALIGQHRPSVVFGCGTKALAVPSRAAPELPIVYSAGARRERAATKTVTGVRLPSFGGGTTRSSACPSQAEAPSP